MKNQLKLYTLRIKNEHKINYYNNVIINYENTFINEKTLETTNISFLENSINFQISSNNHFT